MDVFGSLEADPEVLVSLRCLGLVLKFLWPPRTRISDGCSKSYAIFFAAALVVETEYDRQVQLIGSILFWPIWSFLST